MIERRVELEMQRDLRITKWMDGAVGLRKINSHLPQYPMPYSVSLNSLPCVFDRVNESPIAPACLSLISSASHVLCTTLPCRNQIFFSHAAPHYVLKEFG